MNKIERVIKGAVRGITIAVIRVLHEERKNVAVALTSGKATMIVPVKGKRPRDLSCIAPNCKHKSKGPRYHYLCARHLHTPRKTYEQWAADRRAARG